MKNIVLILLSIGTAVCVNPIGTMSKQVILVFSPHPDDDILGCGGTIKQLVDLGNDVIITYMTSGEAELYSRSKEELAEIREKEAVAAAKILGVDHTIFLRLPDGKLAVRRDSVALVKKIILEFRPHVIFVPHEFDNHPDHKMTHAIVLNALKRISNPHSIQLLGYEVWTPLQTITYRVDVSNTIETKIQALKEHKTQIEIRDYIAATLALGKYRGIMTFVGSYGECFQEIMINKASNGKGKK